MPTAPTPITPYATPPSSSDTANFDARADAKVADDVAKVDEYNDLAENVYDNALEAVAGATTATAQATLALNAASTAVAAAGAPVWVSGTSYATGDPVWSPQDGRVYRRRSGGGGTTDPAADPTNWALVQGGDLQMLIVATTTQTAAVGGRYVLTHASPSTLTAPPTPQAGDRFGVKVANGRVDNLINWNGAKHEGLSDATMTLVGAYLSLEFLYVNATIGWVIV